MFSSHGINHVFISQITMSEVVEYFGNQNASIIGEIFPQKEYG